MLDFGFSRQEMEKELKDIAKGFAEVTGEEIRIPSLRELEKDSERKVAKDSSVDPEVEPVELLKTFLTEEKRLTLDLTKKRESIQDELKKGLEQIKAWSKEQRKKGKTKEDLVREGDKKLQGLKLKIDKKLQTLKKEGFKSFDKLENEYKKKDDRFLEALIRHRRNTKRYQFAGKVALGMTLSLLTFILVGLTVKALLFVFLINSALPEAASQVTSGAAESIGKSLGGALSMSPAQLR